MRKIFFVTVLIIFSYSLSFAQCPTAGFSIPDSVCSGVPFQVTNTSGTGLSYNFDLCSGDMSNTPVGLNYGADPNLNFPQQPSLIKDDGKFYLFVVNFFGNNLLRYDFGNSLENTPVVFAYPGLATLNQPIGLDVIEENGNWYALIANYGSARLSRVDLGTVIDNNVATATDLGQFGFNGPRGVEVAFDGSDYFVFVTNDGGSDVIKIEFGNSIANAPITSSPITNALFSFTWGIIVKYDCELGKWFGFVASFNNSLVHILDFGSSLNNAPVINSSVTTLSNPSGLELTRDGTNWYMVVVSSAFLKVQNFAISNNLSSTPVEIFSDTLGALNNPRAVTILKDSSQVQGFIVNAAGSIARIKWPSPCQASPAFTDTSGSFSAIINSSGYNTISLAVTDSNGFTSYYNDSIYLNASPQVDFTFTSGCEGLPVSFSDSSTISEGTISSWQWNFGDLSPIDNSQNPIHTYSGTGNFLVTLTAESNFGCSSSDTSTITINPIPVAAFNFVNNQCANTPVNFNDQSVASGGTNIIAWTWNFGDQSLPSIDQNPVHSYDSSGTYTIQLIVETDAGCFDSTTSVITINERPVASFTVTETCIGEVTSFINGSTITGGGILTYDWDFGDTFTSTSTDPFHSYAAIAGNYDVVLIATAANGCNDTITQNIRIANKPVAQFTWSPLVVCQGNAVNFTSSSTGTGGDTIALYIWDFGDLTGSSIENPSHVFADTGFYNVTLTVVSPTYCDSSITQQVYVIPGPTASFTSTQVCLNQTTSFSPQFTTPPGTTIDSIVWDFGDGTFFNGLTSPVHLYILPGTYTVIMNLYNNLLCTATYTDSVIVYPLPLANITSSLPCSDLAITFDGTGSTVANDIITSWLWDFDGLGSSNDSIATFIFSDSGNYDITLVVTTANGCSNTIVSPLNVIHAPDFDFTFTEQCDGSPVQFTFISNITPPPPASPTWNFGDGNSSSIFNPSHLFGSADTFNVNLYILNSITGCSAQLTKSVAVHPNPEPGYFASDICEELPLQFSDTSIIESGNIISWNWTFGGGSTSSLQNPVIVFDQPGVTPVTFTATSALGCSATITNSVLIHPKPNAEFTTDPLFGSPPLTVNFINNTSGGQNYSWNFGDNTFGTGQNPGHIYSDTGTYQIEMVATSNFGCTDTAYYSLSVLVPYMDIAVQKIFATVNGSQLRLSADISNQGNQIVNSFLVKGIIENGSIINEIYMDTLLPGQTINYQFNASYQVSPGLLPGFYCVEALYPNDGIDQRSENNGKCSVIDNSFEIFTAYPNPFAEQMTLNFNLPFEGNYSIEIYEDSGKLVYRQDDISGSKGYNKKAIDTQAFRKGVYSCIVRYRDDFRYIRMLKI